jgi:hypothetical protein
MSQIITRESQDERDNYRRNHRMSQIMTHESQDESDNYT